MNHTIKAKNKNSQEVRDINIIDYGDTFEYYDDKWDCVYTSTDFNDLFEVVEDKCDCIEKTCQKDCKKGHTHKTFWCDICCETRGLPKSTPQTEIVEDRFTDEAIDKRTKAFCNLTGFEEPKIKYNVEVSDLQSRFEKRFIDDGLLNISKYCHERVLDFITQEIAKAKEESDKEIIHLTSIIKQLIK